MRRAPALRLGTIIVVVLVGGIALAIHRSGRTGSTAARSTSGTTTTTAPPLGSSSSNPATTETTTAPAATATSSSSGLTATGAGQAALGPTSKQAVTGGPDLRFPALLLLTVASGLYRYTRRRSAPHGRP